MILWKNLKEIPPKRSKLLLLLKSDIFKSGYEIVTARYDLCGDSRHEAFDKIGFDFETECGCRCVCDGGSFIPLENIVGWIKLESLEPERSKREDSQKCEMRCSEHCRNAVRDK